MAAKGSVANIRKKLLSRLSTSDDRRNSPVKALAPRTTDAVKSTDAAGVSTTTTKKDWPLHHQTKNYDRQQSTDGGRQSSRQHHNNVDCLQNVSSGPSAGDITDNSSTQTSAPVDLVASCSTHAHNDSATTSASAITHDVITISASQQYNHVNGTSTSWSNDDDLPWLTRRDTDRHSHHSDGPSSSSSRLPLPPSAWLDPETVVPPPGRVERRLGVTTAGDLRPRDTDRHRHRLTTASRRRLTDKFDELDEEAMSPFTWQSQPATQQTVAMTSCDDMQRHNSHLYDVMKSSPYGTLGRRPVPRGRTASVGSADKSLLVPHARPTDIGDSCSVCSSASATSTMPQDDHLSEIRQLRADLDWAKQQVTCLAANLRTNASAVQVFDETLSKMADQLYSLQARHRYTNCDVNELLIAIENLRTENQRVIDDVSFRPRSMSLCRHARKWDSLGSRSTAACQQLGQGCERRQASRHGSLRYNNEPSLPSNDLHLPPANHNRHHLHHPHHHDDQQQQQQQLSTSTVSLCTTSGSNSVARKPSLRNWLRTSLGKALSRKKDSSSSVTSATMTSRVTHATSLPSIAQPQSPSHNQHSEQPSEMYCATVGRSKRSRHPLPSYWRSQSLLQVITEPPPAVTSAAANDVGLSTSTWGPTTRRPRVAQRTTSLYDPPTAQNVLDMLLKANSQRQVRDGKKVVISVSVSTDVIHDEHHQQLEGGSSEVVIGMYRVLSSSGWLTLDAEITKIFQAHVKRLEAGQCSLGLSASSISSYCVGEVTRFIGAASPDLLPVGYLVGDVNNISISLRGENDESMDQLSFETLISTTLLARYMSVLMQYRRLVVCGPSGMGKTHLALALAHSVVRRAGLAHSADHVAIIHSSRDNNSSCESAAELTSSVTQSCETALVVVLDDVSLTSLQATQLSRCRTFVIATASECPALRHDCTQRETAQLIGEFYVVQFDNHHEPVHGFLGRHLRRRLITQSHLNSAANTPAAAVAAGPVSSDLSRVVDWLPRVWQKVNKFLDVISPPHLDITIGPKLFTACPMDVAKSNVWFTDLWNYFIVSYLAEAIRQSLQSTSSTTRSLWQDIAEWIGDSWPWPLTSQSEPLPLQIRPADVGFDEVAVTGHRTSVDGDFTSESTDSGQHDPMVDGHT